MVDWGKAAFDRCRCGQPERRGDLVTDKQTIRVYDSQAGEYARLTNRENASDPRLEAFMSNLPSGGKVLDLGCGPGAAASRMAQSGLQVDAIDASPEMADMANQLEGVTAWQATFDEITGTSIYDGIWANFSLLHAPRSKMPGHLKALCSALKPGGQFHIGMKLGTGEGRDRLGRQYTYYSQAELTGLLQEAGLTVTGAFTGRGTGLDGTISDWVSLTAHG